MTHSMRYQSIFNGLKFTLHRARVLNNVVITTVIEMVEMVEILDGRVGKHSVERVRYVINNLLHLVIVKYGVISLILCLSARLRLVTILTLLVKFLVVFRGDLCNWASEASPTLGCSIEISHDICVSQSVSRYVCCVPKCVGGITCAHAQSQFWAVKTDL